MLKQVRGTVGLAGLKAAASIDVHTDSGELAGANLRIRGGEGEISV